MPHVVVVGGTAGLGLDVAREYAARSHHVTVAGRDATRAKAVAGELGGNAQGISVDLGEPGTIAASLAGIADVDHLVISATARDHTSARGYQPTAALRLVTIKLVGYTEVVHVLAPRMTERGSIVLFGGLAKDRPYPGSTTLSTVNAAVAGLTRTLAAELAPIRVNSIHPAAVGDTDSWAGRPELTGPIQTRTPTGRLVTTHDVTHAVTFLLENPSVNGVDLIIDGGLRLR
jgi:NAD(P)-dependent dehydrogenase (short-subunit alcohol dehydrogenase family)